MTKFDLKTGMLVTTRDGKVYLVWKERLLGREGYLDLKSYNEDLTFNNRAYPQFDIMFVYAEEYNIVSVYDLMDPLGRKRLYDRLAEPEAKTMSLYELEQELSKEE